MSAGYARPSEAEVADRVAAARGDASRVRLEGAHALKHALRFGADIEVVATDDRAGLLALLTDLAPDVLEDAAARVVQLAPARWQRLVPRPLPSPSLAVALRPHVTVDDVLTAAGRVLVLDRPRHLGNLGAAVRVAAAAGAGGVLTLGPADPWHPTAVRAAAGLQFALPTTRAEVLPTTDRPVVALDPGGTPLHASPLPADALLLVGTERGGLSDALLARADERRAIAMRSGVSSLNLATAVAVALYADG
jgi:RNA methyltransferase, TrmH family